MLNVFGFMHHWAAFTGMNEASHVFSFHYTSTTVNIPISDLRHDIADILSDLHKQIFANVCRFI